MHLGKVVRMKELQNVLERYWYTEERLDKNTIMSEVEACLDDIIRRQERFTLNLTTLKEDIAEYIFNEYFFEYLPSTTPHDLENSKDLVEVSLKSSPLYKEATRLLREAILETANKKGMFRDKDNSSKSKDEFDF